jgi:hypothetical protein
MPEPVSKLPELPELLALCELTAPLDSAVLVALAGVLSLDDEQPARTASDMSAATPATRGAPGYILLFIIAS